MHFPWRMPLYIDMSWPVSGNVGDLAGATLVERRVVTGRGANGAGVEVMKGSWEWRRW